MTGTIAKVFEDKGFGFIKVEGEAKDIYFRVQNVVGEQVAEGDTVSFETEDTDRGKNALNVTKV